MRLDFIAGLTVVALLIPEGMAYAELAGMPPETAFYAAPPGLVLYAIFGTSRQLVVAVSSAIAVMSAATVGAVHPQGSEEFVTFTIVLATITGILVIVSGLLRLGRLAQFFSESVLTGFVFGLALVIAIKQVPKMFGLEAAHGNFFERLWDLFVHLSETHWPSLAVGLSSLILLIVIERYYHRIPAALVAMVFGIVVGAVFQLETRGVHVVGEIPAGLTLPQLPRVSLTEMLWLVPGAFGMMLVMFAEAIGPARSFAANHGYEVDADQELIGMGAANLGAGLFQGFPIGSSLSKSAANDHAGAQSQMSAIIATGVTLVVALFLTPLFYTLPEATLGAIVVVAISGMMRVSKMQRLYRLRRGDFVLALIALLGVLIFEVLVGLIIAVIISLLALVVRASQPKLSILGRTPGHLDFRDVRRHPENRTVPGLLILRPDEGIFFANATALRDEIVAQVRANAEPVKGVLLDLEMSTDLDVPGADMLIELKENLDALQVRLMISRVHEPIWELLERDGVIEEIGSDNIYPRTLTAVLAYLVSEKESQEVKTYFREGVAILQQFADRLREFAIGDKQTQVAEIEQALKQILSDIDREL